MRNDEAWIFFRRRELLYYLYETRELEIVDQTFDGKESFQDLGKGKATDVPENDDTNSRFSDSSSSDSTDTDSSASNRNHSYSTKGKTLDKGKGKATDVSDNNVSSSEDIDVSDNNVSSSEPIYSNLDSEYVKDMRVAIDESLRDIKPYNGESSRNS